MIFLSQYFIAICLSQYILSPYFYCNIFNTSPDLPWEFYRFFSVTGGKDWYDILQPLLIVSWMYGVVFIAFQVFVVFGVFNVLNAVFVESVLDNRDKDISWRFLAFLGEFSANDWPTLVT